MNRARILVVVLDGFDWSILQARPDLCPNLAELAADGCSARLEACSAPITPTGVAALLTGREVDLPWIRERGIGNDAYATSHELIRSRPWTSELHRAGLDLALVNVPLTYPAFPVPKGSYVVAGFPIPRGALDPAVARGRSLSWPRGLDLLGYPVEGVVCDSDTGPGGGSDPESYARLEREIFAWFARQTRRDLEVLWLRGTDSAGHHHWGQAGYEHAVQQADQLLRELREMAETILVISDHGMAELGSAACEPYMRTSHGPTSVRAGLRGGHTMDGILVAAGLDVRARGVLSDQKLVEVAGGIFDLLGVPPMPGMVSNAPAWAQPYAGADGADLREKLSRLGYT